MKGIINGVEYLHSNSVAHRDIKSQNVLLKNGEAIICDFGDSKLIGMEGSSMISLHGTRPWMAPEVIRGIFYSYILI